LGRLVANSRAIDVAVQNGRVTLSGLVLADEHQPLIDHINARQGVAEVKDELTVYERIGDMQAVGNG
jgi:osmotically-inducible protein OsmY